ncbi:MAG: hypothetical protein JXJ19_04585 [Elusimicrobia bacterium]|nr:hypothetical protein [Elusimicrobiota bacterium]
MNHKSSNGTEDIRIRYRFKLNSGEDKEFLVRLDGETLDLINEKKDSYPEWTRLEKFRCPNCTLDEKENEYCPVVINLFDIIDFFKDSVSYEEIDLTIDTEERTYSRHTSLQTGLNSLVGIYMVTSSCPIMEYLKPIVRFHLPFGTIEESSFRMISMYLLAQYFVMKKGGQADWDLKNLVNIYEDIRIVNRNFCEKLTQIKVQDATLNALVSLDCFAFSISYFIDKDRLEKLESLFAAYLDK